MKRTISMILVLVMAISLLTVGLAAPASAAFVYGSDPVINKLFREAESYIGTPYVWGGKTPSGFDCSGFVTYVLSNADLYDVDPYYVGAADLYNLCDPVPAGHEKPGDLLFFEDTGSTTHAITHVGFYAGNGQILHAGNPVGYASYTTGTLAQRYLYAGRLTLNGSSGFGGSRVAWGKDLISNTGCVALWRNSINLCTPSRAVVDSLVSFYSSVFSQFFFDVEPPQLGGNDYDWNAFCHFTSTWLNFCVGSVPYSDLVRLRDKINFLAGRADSSPFARQAVASCFNISSVNGNYVEIVYDPVYDIQRLQFISCRRYFVDCTTGYFPYVASEVPAEESQTSRTVYVGEDEINSSVALVDENIFLKAENENRGFHRVPYWYEDEPYWVLYCSTSKQYICKTGLIVSSRTPIAIRRTVSGSSSVSGSYEWISFSDVNFQLAH